METSQTPCRPSTEVTRSKNLALAAMVFAVAMMFIDSTIVSIAAPTILRELGLTGAQIQWVVNGYLLARGLIVLVVFALAHPGGKVSAERSG